MAKKTTIKSLAKNKKDIIIQNIVPLRAINEDLSPVNFVPNKEYADPIALYNNCIKYFHWCEANPLRINTLVGGTEVETTNKRPYTIQGLSSYIGVSVSNLRAMHKQQKYKQVLDYVFGKVEQDLLENAINGTYKANLVAKLLGIGDTNIIQNYNTVITNQTISEIANYFKADDLLVPPPTDEDILGGYSHTLPPPNDK